MSQNQQQKQHEQQEPSETIEQQREREQKGQQIKLQQIMHEVNPQQNPVPQTHPRASQSQPPVVKNPIYYYKGHQKYNWRLSELQPTSIIEQLQIDPIEFSEELPFSNDINITVTQTPIISSGMNRHIGYTAKKHDKNGDSSFTRRYTEYIAFRKKLTELWPGVFLPTFPNKILIGSNEEQVIRSRVKYINHFWRKLSWYDKVYYTEQISHFMNDDVNIEATLQKIQQPKVAELLQKYKNKFTDAYLRCHQEEFMYKKNQAPVIFQQFQTYFGKKKIDLLQFKESFMRLAQLKSKYIKAVSKLNQNLLPAYENVLFKWFNGTPLEEKQPSILQKLNRKSQENKPQVQKQSPPVVLQQGNKKIEFPNFLYSSQAYKSKLQDTAHQIQDYNSSIWILYDVIKFELQDIDTVIFAIEQVKYIQREIEYLKRSITVNKEQIESLNNKKTTLKTFFMGGSEDDKKTRLTNESQAFEEKLEKTIEFYHILLALVEEQLIKYHQERIQYYTKAVKKSIVDQLGIARSVMDFHIYEYQLFAKQRHRKIQEIYDQSPSLKNQQEIKE